MTKKTKQPLAESCSTVGSSFPTMSSFTIKATIPTGAYSNISPEMTFTDCSFDDVENTIMPKMEEMFAKYLGFNDRVIAQQKEQELQRKANIASLIASVQPTVVAVQEQSTQTPLTQTQEQASQTPVSPSMINALAVVESSKTVPALTLMKKQIADSVKLTVDEQATLNALINKKLAGLTN